jgi:GNAT superfamily N-acetyltransferase
MTGVSGPVHTTIRTAVSADLPELQRVFRAASLSNAGDVPLLTARPEFLHFAGEAIADGGTRVAVTVPDGVEKVVGFSTVVPGVDGEPELEDLFVDPPWHRHGIARALVEDAVRRLREAGRVRLWVTANPHAADFYAAVGFGGSEPVLTEGGRPGARLHLDIG